MKKLNRKQLNRVSKMISNGLILSNYSFGRSGNANQDNRVVSDQITAMEILRHNPQFKYAETDSHGETCVVRDYLYGDCEESIPVRYYLEELREKSEFNKQVDQRSRGRLYKLALAIKKCIEESNGWLNEVEVYKWQNIELMLRRWGWEFNYFAAIGKYAYEDADMIDDPHVHMPSTFDLMKELYSTLMRERAIKLWCRRKGK